MTITVSVSDQYIQQAKRRYTDSRMNYQLNNVSNELLDTQKIMVQNIEDVIHRGESLNSMFYSGIQCIRAIYLGISGRNVLTRSSTCLVLDVKAGNLSEMSRKYKEDAVTLNRKSMLTKIAALVVLIVIALLFIRFKFY